MNIGVISDTHGLLREQAVAALHGVDAIIHAGDIGSAEIIPQLQHIAPLTIIKGNIDRAPWARTLPDTAEFCAHGHRFYILHNLKELDLNPAGYYAAVICGHSHKPSIKYKDQVLYFNPGSAGPRRFSLPVSVGRLRVDAQGIEAELIELNIPPGTARKKRQA